MRRIASLLGFAAAAMPATALATDDKRGYSILDPTPRELWRALSTDRPDFTESPYTVDAGAVQLELSFFDYARNGDEEAWAVAPTNLKLGLLTDLDLQFVFDPYVREESGAATRDGFGDVQLRLKMNLLGNDGGDFAVAVMPFLKVPTASDDLGNDHFEGGLIVPFATDLADGVGLGLMFEADFVFDDADDGYDTEFITTAVLGFDITEELGFYVEGVGIMSTDPDVDFRGIVGTGATCALTADIVVDAGVSIGLSGDADDFNVFTGLTLRF